MHELYFASSDLLQPPVDTVELSWDQRRAMAIYFWHNNYLTERELFEFCQIGTQRELMCFWLAHELGNYVSCPEAAAAEGDNLESQYRHRNIQIVCMLDNTYPVLLKKYKMYPPVLAVQGKIELLAAPQVAMVGSRKCHSAAEPITRMIADHLMLRGFVITSGGAMGIDALSHRQAMCRHKPTVIVTGTGPDEIYPRENKAIFEYAVQNGAIVSQYPLNTPAVKTNFPARNAIIAGLSVATVVVQCREKSGALYTARFAHNLQRPVLVAAMPGFDKLTEGALGLVKSGKALLLSHKSDLDLLGIGSDYPKTGLCQHSIEFGIPPEYGDFFMSAENTDACVNILLSEAQSVMLTVLKSQPMTREWLRQEMCSRNLSDHFDEELLELELTDCVEVRAGLYYPKI